eukprot:COSAG06_NODE_12193_length_1411_cov_1.580030_1_plen_77_part_00
MTIRVTTFAMLGTLDSAATMPEARECPATATFDQSSFLSAVRYCAQLLSSFSRCCRSATVLPTMEFVESIEKFAGF